MVGREEHPVEALTVLFFVLKARGTAPSAADVDIGGFWRHRPSSHAVTRGCSPCGRRLDTAVFGT